MKLNISIYAKYTSTAKLLDQVFVLKEKKTCDTRRNQ